MKHSDYSVMYVGGYQSNTLVCASLILYKTIGPNIKYGYAPRGFLVDYYNNSMLENFTKKIKSKEMDDLGLKGMHTSCLYHLLIL